MLETTSDTQMTNVEKGVTSIIASVRNLRYTNELVLWLAQVTL